MANDVHYIMFFSAFFLLLGLISPLINAEFNSSLTEEDVEGALPVEDEHSSVTVVSIILNMFTLPFWTFGLPAWVNLWILPIIRIPFIFVIARNVWIGGGS